jgi:hypothetical protein
MDTENFEKLKNLLMELEGKEKILDAQTTLLFNLHNFFYPNKQEYGKSCASCRFRVYNRMKNFYEEQKEKYTK